MIAVLRFIMVLIVTFIWSILSFLVLPFIPQKYMPYVVRVWAIMTLVSAGIRIQRFGVFEKFVQTNRMIVANHISWLDVPILYTVYAMSFIGKSEMKKWLLIGQMIKVGGTIFINRKNKRDLVHINGIVSKKLAGGASIGLFPEGKTGHGDGIAPFKTPLLESAIKAKSKIIPVVIIYHNELRKRTTKVTYAGGIPLYRSVINTLSIKRIYVNIHSLPSVNAGDFANREQLSTYLYDNINNIYTTTKD